MRTDRIGTPAGRDPSVDVIKGIAILLIVYGHTCPFGRNFYYLFNLQMFLLCSGYCFKNRIHCWADWRRYMAGKLKTLYVPCAAYNGVFALLGGLFLRLGLYTDDPAFLTMTKDWPVPQKLYVVRGLGDILRKFFRVILMTDTTQMGTGTWFLIMLFAISAFHGAVCCLTAELEQRKKRMVTAGLFLLAAAVAQFADLPFAGWMYPRCFCYCYIVYLLGVGLRDLDLKFPEHPLCGVLSFVILVILSRFYFIDIANARIDNVLPYLAGSLAGWCMLKPLANRIAATERLSRAFCFIGRHTVPIVCLHILCFKPVTWLYIRTQQLPEIYLASFHVDFDAPQPWKFLYLAAGAAIPLLLAVLWQRLRQKAAGRLPGE